MKPYEVLPRLLPRSLETAGGVVDSLVAYLDRAGFFALNSSYRPGAEGCKDQATDQPSAILSVTHGGRTKTVRYY
jgi:hypothetical protein